MINDPGLGHEVEYEIILFSAGSIRTYEPPIIHFRVTVRALRHAANLGPVENRTDQKSPTR